MAAARDLHIVAQDARLEGMLPGFVYGKLGQNRMGNYKSQQRVRMYLLGSVWALATIASISSLGSSMSR